MQSFVCDENQPRILMYISDTVLIFYVNCWKQILVVQVMFFVNANDEGWWNTRSQSVKSGNTEQSGILQGFLVWFF